MPLDSPRDVVVGAADLGAASAFLTALGFATVRSGRLSVEAARGLYGLGSAAEMAVLAMPGADRGRIRLVETKHPAPASHVFARGPHALDLYTTDMARSLATAKAAGALCRAPASYSVGPLTLSEGKAVGPDGLAIVFIEAVRRRPSLLDCDPARQHSEVHSFVFTVASVDTALPFWKEAGGLGAFLDATLREPAVAAFMGLPRPDTPLRLAMLADDASRPIRLEILEFPEDEGPEHPTWPLRAGLHAVTFEVPSLEAAQRALARAQFGEIVTVETGGGERTRAVTATAPGGLRFELWEAPSA